MRSARLNPAKRLRVLDFLRAQNGFSSTAVLLYENEIWNLELASELESRGFEVRRVDLRHADFSLDEQLPPGVYFNRLSPSAALRGHAAALDLGRAMVRKLEADGHRVINGSEAFEHELSKLRQYVVLRQLGLQVPKTVVLTPGSRLPVEGFDLEYPAILKPNTGGSGAGVALVSSAREAFEHLQRNGDRGESWLLQEKIESSDGSILRLEFIGERLVYAMRVRAVNTFNLCPAEACERPAADASLGVAPEVRFEHESHPRVDLVDAARRVLAATGLEVGGVEIMIERSGRPVFIDVNATSVYRSDMAAAAEVDPFSMLAEHLREVSVERRCA